MEAERLTMTLKMTAPVAGWQLALSALNTLQEEITVLIEDDGLYFSCQDSSHVTLLQFQWKAKNMKNYVAEKDRLAFRVDTVKKIFSRFPKDAVIDVTKTEKETLKITDDKKTFEVKTISTAMVERSKTPKVEWDVTFNISLSKLNDAIADISTISDTLKIISKDGILIFSGDDMDGTAKTIMPGISTVKDSTSIYTFDYLKPMLAALQGHITDVTLSFADSKPMKLETAIEDAGIIEYWIAPRVMN